MARKFSALKEGDQFILSSCVYTVTTKDASIYNEWIRKGCSNKNEPWFRFISDEDVQHSYPASVFQPYVDAMLVCVNNRICPWREAH